MRHVALIGLPGCGKSSVGRHLALALHYTLVDLDLEIVHRTGKPIPEIFEEVGESGFREMEQSVLESVHGYRNEQGIVLATGGGVVVTEACREILKSHWKTIYLEATIPTLRYRLEAERVGRPLLHGQDPLEDRLKRLLREREILYQDTAHQTIQVDNKSPSEIAQAIVQSLLG